MLAAAEGRVQCSTVSNICHAAIFVTSLRLIGFLLIIFTRFAIDITSYL
jgi:hypothetical protein